MVSKFLNNQKGMTILEVMVAGSLAAGVFFYINQAIVRLNKTQIRFERKENALIIKNNMIKMLEDVNSWISNPEKDVPMPTNNFNFYYYKSPGADIEKVSFNTKEVNELDSQTKSKIPVWNCPPLFEECRVFLWSYGNKLLTPKETQNLTRNHFRVVVGIVTPVKLISRSYLPEFKVLITDTNEDKAISARSGIFHVNATGSKRSGKSSLVEINGRKIDINSRRRCYLDFLKESNDREAGRMLCEKAESLAPSKCFKHFKSEFKVSDVDALIACVGAKNAIPQECFRLAKKSYNVPETHMAILCSAATSLFPLKCISELKDDKEKIEIFKICSRAEDLTPAKCYEDLMKDSKDNLSVALRICPQHK